MDPRAGLDDVEKRTFLPLPVLELDPSSVQPVASRYTVCANPAPTRFEKYAKLHLRLQFVGLIVVKRLTFTGGQAAMYTHYIVQTWS
jgi:hypothetical protein